MAGRWGWPILGVACVLVTAGAVLGDGHGTVVDAVISLAFPVLGIFLLARSVVALGRLCLVPALGAVAFACDNHAAAGLPGHAWTGWVATWIWVPAIVVPATLVVLLVPDGKLPSPRWRPPAYGAGVLIAVFTLLMALAPVTRYGAPNPLGVRLPSQVSGVFPVLVVLLVAAAGMCVVGLLSRLRRARGATRTQLAWVLAGAVVLVLTTFFNPWLPAPWNSLVEAAGVLAFPAGIGVAMVNHGLYDTDRLLRRTLTYGLLVGALGLGYVGVVAGVGALVGPGRPATAALAATVVAVAVNPLRQFLGRAVDRALYGRRGDPYGVLTDLSRQLARTVEPQAILAVLASSIASALRVPYVQVHVGPAVVTAGVPTTLLDEAIPLVFQGATLGEVRLAPRSQGEGLDERDLRLLRDIAAHAGGPVAAALRTLELQEARERLVAAREEERRRLARDLHDGVGPILAGLGFTADAARNAVRSDPGQAEELLGAVRGQVREAAATVRRLSRELRPPDLDQRGLVPAIEGAAAALSPLEVTVTATGDLARLDAATEVAAYLITREALTNCARHSGASTCEVVISRDADGVRIIVTDDGRGLPEPPRAGVGLAAMRERAEELGGTFTVGSRPAGGTEVRVHLPTREG